MPKNDGHKLAGNRLDPLSANTGAVVEAATGEVYQSVAAMAKHEASESGGDKRHEIKMFGEKE
jgi:hypothetical protein